MLFRSEAFSEYAIEDRTTAPYEYVMIAMKRWYMELPKYAKNAKSVAGKKVAKEYKLFLQEMRKNVGSYNLIFNAIPKIYGAETVNRKLAEKVRMTKNYFDGALECLKNELSEKMRNMFCTLDTAACEKMSLPSIIRDWCEKLDQDRKSVV